MEDQVERNVAKSGNKVRKCIANCNANTGEFFIGRIGDVLVMRARHDEQFVRTRAPEGADNGGKTIVQNESFAVFFSFCSGAHDAATFETLECAFFFQDFARHEWQPKKLTVWVSK